jgi:oligoendopeptidase F
MRLIYNLTVYAGLLKDSDMNVAENQTLDGRVETLYTSFESVTSFIEPELLALPEERVKEYLADDSFKDFRRAMSEIVRWKSHTLSVVEEKILAEFTAIGNASNEIYDTFTTTDMPRPSITFSTGETVRLDNSVYFKYRSMQNTADRTLLFEKFWDNYGLYQNTFAKTLSYQTQYYVTEGRVKKFGSSIEKILFEKELPPDFYTKLIGHIRSILPALHEYMALKKEILGLDKVRFQDMYVPLTNGNYDEEYSFEKAAGIVNAAVAVMPDEYREATRAGMTPGAGWIDVYPSKGKSGGGYCTGGSYSTHPFILLNWTDDYDSLTTLAHEMGHGMHSYFSNKYQPFANVDINIFNAEVASVFNEMLLSDYLLKNAKSDEEKIFLLDNFIETTRGTVFRQMMFAEFEKQFYDLVEAGSPLTPDAMNGLYKEINEEYYGAARGLYEMDPRYAVEWSIVPHFYYNYYVFQYVVGYVGGLSLATKILDGSLPARQYVDGMLAAGGSKSPLDILRDAGLDMTSDEPYELTAKVFKERLAELRKLLIEKRDREARK